MFLAEKTVKNYVSNLLAKLGMARRSEAAAYAARIAERRRATGCRPRPDVRASPTSRIRIACGTDRRRASRSARTCRSRRRCGASSRRPSRWSAPATGRSASSTNPAGDWPSSSAWGLDPSRSPPSGHYPEGHGILGVLIVEPTAVAPRRPRRPSRQLRVSRPPPADDLVPRGADPRPRPGVRQSLPDREAERRSSSPRRTKALAVALAGAAAIAIENARLHARLRDLAWSRTANGSPPTSTTPSSSGSSPPAWP